MAKFDEAGSSSASRVFGIDALSTIVTSFLTTPELAVIVKTRLVAEGVIDGRLQPPSYYERIYTRGAAFAPADLRAVLGTMEGLGFGTRSGTPMRASAASAAAGGATETGPIAGACMDRVRWDNPFDLHEIRLVGGERETKRLICPRAFGGFCADDHGSWGEDAQTWVSHKFHSLTLARCCVEMTDGPDLFDSTSISTQAGSRNVVLLLDVTYLFWSDPYTSLKASQILSRLSFSVDGGGPMLLCSWHQSECESLHEDGTLIGHDADGNYREDYRFMNPRYWKGGTRVDNLDTFKNKLANDDPFLKCDLATSLSLLCVHYALVCYGNHDGCLCHGPHYDAHPWAGLPR